jgi:hypothetical protein
VANYWATWSPETGAGVHEIYVFVPRINGTARQAIYEVSTAGGAKRSVVDQLGISDRWVAIGEFQLGGGPQTVRVTDYSGETDYSRVVAVDAVRYVPRASVTAPLPRRLLLPALLVDYPPVPEVPTLSPVQPPEGQSSFTVAWSAAKRAVSYVLQEATDAAFTAPVTRYSGAGTSVVVPSQGIAGYHYRVLARNSWGDSAWSNVESVAVRWERESNNTFATSTGMLQPGLAHYGFPNDYGDFWRMEITGTKTLTAELTNHTGGGPYLALYAASTGLRVALDSVSPYRIIYTAQPGTYYVYVYTGWSYNQTQPYTVKVTAP